MTVKNEIDVIQANCSMVKEVAVYVSNCYVEMKPEECVITYDDNTGEFIPHLDGYAIIPLDKYKEMIE